MRISSTFPKSKLERDRPRSAASFASTSASRFWMQTDRFPKISAAHHCKEEIWPCSKVFIPSRTQSDRCSSEELISVNFIINRHALLMFRRQGLSSNLHYGKNFSGQQWITIYLKLIYSHFISWSKATLKPISIFVTRGAQYNLAAQRQLSLSIVKSPPRTTLSVPVFGPVGFQANPPEPP